MDSVFIESQRKFESDLTKQGDYWQIFRPSTFVDLVKFSFYNFQQSNNKELLYDILNQSIRALIVSRIGSIDLTGDIQKDFDKFNLNQGLLVEKYKTIIIEIQFKFADNRNYTLYDLNNQIQYIKVINQLALDNFSENIFEEIIWITYLVLKSLD